MTLPFTGDYRDGDMVQCQRCAKNVRVKYYDRDTVVVVSTQEQQTLALRCQYCGYVLCDSCAHPANSLFPTCPSCQREWGPYYFTHDAISPSSSKTATAGDVPPTPQAQPPVQSWVQDVPLAPMESLGAGEADLYRDAQDWKRRKALKKIMNLVGLILLASLIFFFTFGPGRPLAKKGLGLLSTRPTRSPAPTATLNYTLTPVGGVPIKPTLPASEAVFTPGKPTSTVAVSAEASPTNKAGSIPSPTLKKTATAGPTDTSTPLPTSTQPSDIPADCIPVLSVTLEDVGKIMCVTGTVVFTTQKDTAFSIYFSFDEGYFRIVIYDRVPKDIDKGVCVKVTGEIKTLLGSPVMALGYHDVIEICTP